MREVVFIKQNKEKWVEFEKALYKDQERNAEQMADLFIKLNNDLAYAQTYYPRSNVVKYLNALSAKAYQKIYAQEKRISSFFKFWKIDIPLICYTHRYFLYTSILIFLIFVLIGVLSAGNDEDFVRSILGDGYVNQTLENIEKGDPLAIYSNESPLGDLSSFLAITINNILVSFRAFIYGIVAGIGTLKVLMQNGIMVGAFQYMFYDYDAFAISLRTIWVHGAMEIFAITICGGAGLVLGTSYIFPSDLPRKKAFAVKAKQSVLILISTLPFFLAAGFLEGFVTQYANDMPIFLAWSIIIVSFSIIVYYYLIFPVRLSRKMNIEENIVFHDFAEEKY